MQAYRSWFQVFSTEHLEFLFYQKTKGNPAVGTDWVTTSVFEKRLSSEVEVILRKCNNRTYHFSRYCEKLISKGAAKPPWCISIPTTRDKLTLCALNEVIVDVYGNAATTPMPQAIINALREALSTHQFDSFIKIDISSFYASIDHEILIKKLRRKIRKAEVLHLISSAIKTQTIKPNAMVVPEERLVGIPEGLSISNSLANIFMQSIDSKYCAKSNSMYWRYVDDIILLCNHDRIEQAKTEFVRDLSYIGLSVNTEKAKTGEIKEGFEYLGYYIDSNKVSVRKSSIVTIERTLEAIFRSYSKAEKPNIEYLVWKINLKITGFILNNNKYGWVFFYSQITDLSCLAHLDWLIRTLCKRYGVDKAGFKSFLRSYHEITKSLHTTRYIPNLDTITLEEKRHIVQEIYGEAKKNDDDAIIEQKFRHIMRKEIHNIQKDVQSFS